MPGDLCDSAIEYVEKCATLRVEVDKLKRLLAATVRENCGSQKIVIKESFDGVRSSDVQIELLINGDVLLTTRCRER